nr:hypothetical protein [Tanacetum cinerariifolium]
MNTTQTQQKALDDALVAPTDSLEFKKCIMRLKTDIKPKKATFELVLDALALTSFYRAFQITADKPVQATKGIRIKTKAKLATKRRKKDFYISHASGSGDGVNTHSKVPDEQQQKTSEEANINDDDSDDNDESGDERTESDSDKDVNVNLENKDADMTYVDQGAIEQQNASHLSGFEKEEEDAHVKLTPVLDTHKTGGPTQSSSVYSDFTSMLLNLDNPSPTDNEIASLMDTTAYHATAIPEITLSFTISTPPPPPFFNPLQKEATPPPSEATTFFTSLSDFTSSSQPQSSYEAAAVLSEFELTKILIDKIEKNKPCDVVDYKRELYDALVKSYNTDKDIFESYGEVFSLKKSRHDKDKDQNPSAGSHRGTKRKKSSKDADSSRYSRSKEKKSSSISKDASQSQHKSFGKSAHVEEPSYTVEDSGMQQDQEFITRDNDEQPADKEVTKANWFKKPKRPPTPDPD